ncbi:hypothetical protein CGRA01v4_02616 [Colletotrichum graminicola]|nr:hypothetical protein CGRA01v4_02616 [Colletotrichum graminicola]
MPPDPPPTSKQRGAGTLLAWSRSPSTLVTSSAPVRLTLTRLPLTHSAHHPSRPTALRTHQTKRKTYHAHTPSPRAQSSSLLSYVPVRS